MFQINPTILGCLAFPYYTVSVFHQSSATYVNFFFRLHSKSMRMAAEAQVLAARELISIVTCHQASTLKGFLLGWIILWTLKWKDVVNGSSHRVHAFQCWALEIGKWIVWCFLELLSWNKVGFLIMWIVSFRVKSKLQTNFSPASGKSIVLKHNNCWNRLMSKLSNIKQFILEHQFSIYVMIVVNYSDHRTSGTSVSIRNIWKHVILQIGVHRGLWATIVTFQCHALIP